MMAGKIVEKRFFYPLEESTFEQIFADPSSPTRQKTQPTISKFLEHVPSL